MFTKEQIKLVVIVIIVIVFSGFYIAINKFNTNYQGKTERQDSEVTKLKQEVEALKNKKPEIVKQTIVKEALVPKIKNDIPSIIKKWRPRVAFIACSVSNWHTGKKLGTVSGSGFLFSIGGIPTVLTNKHVLVDMRDIRTTADFYETDLCQVTFPDDNRIYNALLSDMMLGFKNGMDVDWGAIAFKNPDTYITALLSSNLSTCENAPVLGDSIIILGYPAIGSSANITATGGIISGFDGDFYITDAKVEYGNSGGAAILINNDCYLGLPTFVTVGNLESMARIMKWQAVITTVKP